MFILFGSISAVLITIIQFFVFNEKRNAGRCIGLFIRNELVINLVSLAILKNVFKYAHIFVTVSYGMDSFLKFFALSLCVGLVFMFVCAVFEGHLVFEQGKMEKSAGAILVRIFYVILTALGSACFFGTIWGKKSFGDVAADQLIVNLTSPTEGTESAVVVEIFEEPVAQMLLVTTLFAIFVFSGFRILYKHKKKIMVVFNDYAKRLVSLALALLCAGYGIFYLADQFKLMQLYYAYVLESDLIDSNYADPRTTQMTFPQEKRNLIHIYLESMENTFLPDYLGGYDANNYMPQLTDLSYEGMVFSNNETKFGGPLQATGTQWSVAAMINMTMGLPMKVPDKQNRYGSEDNFLPGACTLTDILKQQGYEQTVMFGANAKFGGLSYYYKSHGDIKIFDYNYAKDNGFIPEDYYVWWGYEDDKLYEFAMDEITRLYETGKPFNFTMETADTHRPHGYLSENAPTPFDDHYANAIAYSTSQAVDFVRWIQKQPFYDNTTIVIIGDHLSMDTDFFADMDKDYLRTQYNLIINPAPEVANTSADRFVNRQYANFDMFPTIMASIGVRIEGDMLGIGTNLFSDKQTLIEQYGIDKVNNELNKKSILYNDQILAGQNLPSVKPTKPRTTASK